MGKFLVGLGVLILFLGLGFSFLVPAQQGVLSVDIPRLGSGANAVQVLPVGEVNAVIDTVNVMADAESNRGVIQRKLAHWSLFGVFILGGLITVAAGLQKIRESKKQPIATLALVIALLGIASALSTSAAAYTEKLAKSHFACVGQIEKQVTKTIKNLTNESNELAAKQYLTQLRRTAEQCAA